MTLEEFYEAVGGDLAEVRARLAKDERILKYLNKFVDSTDYDELVTALGESRYEDAFRFVHNLKGVAANLGLRSLFEVSHVLCEELRGGAPQNDVTDMLNAVTEKNQEAKEAIKQLQ